MPRDLVLHDQIQSVYDDFYYKLDKRLNASVSGPDQAFTDGPVIENDEESMKSIHIQYNEQKMVDKDLIKSREWMPRVPLLALKINIKEN